MSIELDQNIWKSYEQETPPLGVEIIATTDTQIVFAYRHGHDLYTTSAGALVTERVNLWATMKELLVTHHNGTVAYLAGIRHALALRPGDAQHMREQLGVVAAGEQENTK